MQTSNARQRESHLCNLTARHFDLFSTTVFGDALFKCTTRINACGDERRAERSSSSYSPQLFETLFYQCDPVCPNLHQQR
jgi:hypothetical protein